jgi:ubiquinone/menaquinone biosynthesis C-methylase UbiE
VRDAAEREQGHPWFAAVYDLLNAPAERGFLREVREDVIGGAAGRVLEIGCGTGASFPYYREVVTELVATEPDPYMLERARRRAHQLGRHVDIRQAPAEALPFDARSFDTVVSTLVLCTVRDPARALAEVKRVLTPEGEFRFYEHVRYPHAFGAFWQDLVTPVWHRVFAGCHPNRDIVGLIRAAGFGITQLEERTPLPPIPPVYVLRLQVKGRARPA